MIDITALRVSAAFRRVFVAQLVSSIGSQVTLIALMYQVYHLTGSELKVGLLGLVQVVPTMTLALLGGAIADAMDRRRLLVLVQVALFMASGSLALLALMEAPPLWLLYVLAAASSAFAAIDGPARTAVVPMLVAHAELRSAIQLREVLTQSGRVLGPVIGGILIAAVGVPAAYAVDALSFAFAFVLFLGLPSLMPLARRKVELSAIVEALQFVRRRPALAATFWADLAAMILGMPRAVFPALAVAVYHIGPGKLGLLYAAPAAGAVLGLGFAGLTSRVRREGLAVLICVSVWGAAMAVFSLTPWLWFALVLLAVAGAADMVSAIFRQTMLLTIVPDELRGRLSSVHIMVVTGGPPLGDLRAGAAADFVGLRTSLVASGVACVAAMGVLAVMIPSFARWVDPKREALEARQAAMP